MVRDDAFRFLVLIEEPNTVLSHYVSSPTVSAE